MLTGGGELYSSQRIIEDGYTGDKYTSVEISQNQVRLNYSKGFDDQTHADFEKNLNIILNDNGVQINGNVVVSVIDYVGGSYIKTSDGTKICWGQISCGGNASVTIVFPFPYSSAPFVFVNSNKQGDSRDNNASCTSRTTTQAVLRQCNSSSTLFWLSIGK